jgi:hypothetical protein
MPTEKDMVAKLNPDHIRDSVPSSESDLKEDVSEVTDTTPKEKGATEDLRSNREYTFKFDWKSRAGKRYTGEFTNKILSIRERQSAGIARAKFGGGMPTSSIDVVTNEINLMLSHMMYSLIDRPTWADELMELEDLRLIQEIYAEVALHEATFFGYGTTEEGS